MKKIAITLTIMAMSIFCFGQNYLQTYHQTVYTNIDGTTYVTSINGHGSAVNVTTYEVTPKYSESKYSESALKAKEELNKKIDQTNNEMKLRNKWEYGEITYEEYCAAVPQEFRSAKKDKDGFEGGGWKLSEAMHRLNVKRLAEGKDIIKSYPRSRDEGYWEIVIELDNFKKEITKELEEARIATQSRD